jgi:tRNA threonylcarbamoyl adenosine modification protein (Sua5/YciO/YrdC/YwlC family)
MSSLEIREQSPDDRKLRLVANDLIAGDIAICPTDTLYAFVCTLSNRAGIEKICKLVGKKPEKANLSIICSDLKHISDYTLQFSKSTYKLMNRNLPGPFTFILRANNKVPKLFLSNRKSLGIRVPNSKIAMSLVELCGEPLVAASVHHHDSADIILNHIEDIENQYGHQVAWTIDAGEGGLMGSAIIDCTGEEPEILREGPSPIL